MKKPDGRIDPYGTIIKKMWPIAYGKPIEFAVRGTDSYGAGHHEASRGKSVHDGTDYTIQPLDNK